MKYDKVRDISCYEEFEIQCDLRGISNIDILKEIGHKINNYYFFISNDGIFYWFDLKGNHVEDPGVLKEVKAEHIDNSITKCIIPDSVIRIGDEAFSFCKSLMEITIPNSVTSIGNSAFFSCSSLKDITIPGSVVSVGYDTFFNCYSLKEIIINNGVKSIGNGAFYRCKTLSSITMPNSITNIDILAFSYCDALEEVIFKGRTLEEVKLMDNYPFGIKDKSIIKCEKIKIDC